ncbi:hypothetical protein [Terasakiella sp.]|uniref:hypothetical protein n=1 Tax=Terasakiella sp. TaxID=2034861 RepID=UPI003AA7F9A2
MLKSVLIVLLTLMGVSACVSNPQYRDLKQADEAEIKATDVNFHVLSPFYRDPPDCVAVMISHNEENPQMAALISTALARHLGEKVDRVIFPRKTRHLAKRLGLDLQDKRDRQRFSRQTKCRFFAVAELYDLGDDYVGIFAKKHIGVRVDLKRISDDALLWQAAHTVWRADGGLPLSPVGALSGMASAAMFAQDNEIMPSLIDDALRRMVRTLPYGMAGVGS